MSEDRLEPILSAQPWRLLCALREETPREAEPILRADERLDAEARETLLYELHHTLLPELAADGLVEFVDTGELVWQGPRFETLRPLLERPQEPLGDLDAGPFAYDDDTETVRYDPEESVEQLLASLADEHEGDNGNGTPW